MIGVQRQGLHDGWPVDLGLVAPQRILFGRGAVASVASELDRLGTDRPLLVVDPAVEGLPWATSCTGMEGVPTFAGMHANTSESDVAAGLAVYQSNRCNGVVAIGGGSAIDGAKLVRLLATHAGPLGEYSVDAGSPRTIRRDLPPLLAVPTTAGTGTEVGRAALVRLAESGWKALVKSPHLVPSTAILDPQVTVTLPPRLTAAVAIDGLSHCIEELLCRRTHPVIDALAAEGIRLIRTNLVSAFRDGSDLDAREGLLMASLLGGLGLQKGLGAVHALSHPLAALGVHHGTANGVLLPHVLRFNAESVPDKVALVAELLGSRDAASAVEELLAACGLPSSLAEIGVSEDDLPRMVTRALQEPSAASNPRILDAGAIRDLYGAAL